MKRALSVLLFLLAAFTATADARLIGNDLIGFGARQTAEAVTYRYLRINITSVNGGNRINLTEMEWLVGATAYPTSNMTSNSAPSPLVASASSELTGNEAYIAFDGTINGLGDDWITDPAGTTSGNLKIDLGSGNGIAPTSAKVYCGGETARCPQDFTLEGSNNDSTWTTLKTLSGETSWTVGTANTYTIP